VEGRPDPGVKNHLRNTRSLQQRIDLAELIQSLTEHPGWALMDELVEEHRLRGAANLAKQADQVALSMEMQKRIDYAKHVGAQSGITFHRDVVASVLDSAKTAAAELKKTAALDDAAERS
jgi:hypothetical protein